MVSVLLPLATGFEEIEAITVIDILRRAGVAVTVAALSEPLVVGSHSIAVLTDTTLEDLGDDTDAIASHFEALILPGGLGTQTLQTDQRIASLVRAFYAQEQWLAAICAAPLVFAQVGLLASRQATSFFGAADYAQAMSGEQSLGLEVGSIGDYRTEAVVMDGRVITSRGAGTAVAFALTIVAVLVGIPVAEKIARSIHAFWQAKDVPGLM